MSRILVYTVILGNYDFLPEVVAAEGIEYYCFTDSIPEDCRGWNCIYTAAFFKDNKLNSGYFKTHPHLLFPPDSIVVWIDSNIDKIKLTVEQILLLLQDHSIVTMSHRMRKTIFGESAIIAEFNLDNRNKVLKWESELKSLGFPDDQGLGETGFLIRDLRNPKVRNFNETWWRFLFNGSRRDQLSFIPALWYVNLEKKLIQPEDSESKRTLFLKYQFREHSNPVKRNIENKFPALDPQDYASFCWMELRPIQTASGIKEFFPISSEKWNTQTLETIRALNDLVHQHKVSVKENYCYLEKQNISKYSTPDVRYAWKREFLRKSVLPSRWGIEIGFGHGYSTAIMLGDNPSLSIIAIEPNPDNLVYQCELSLVSQYDRRLEVHYGDSDKVLNELGQKLPLEKIEFIHYNVSEKNVLQDFWKLMNWFLCKASVGCRLILSENPVEIDAAMKLAMSEIMVEPLNPGIPDVAGNTQFIKIREVSPQDFLHLKLLFADTQSEYQPQLAMKRVVERLKELTTQNQEKEEKLKMLTAQHEELKVYTHKLEQPRQYLKIKLRWWTRRFRRP